MILEELLRRGSESTTGKMATSLHCFTEAVAEKAKEHAKRILAQLPEFDLHDEVHLAAVLTNLEQIIGSNTLSKLSVYELFFLHAASQLHDVGMALPDSELNAIGAVEAENSPDDKSWRKDFSTNGHGPLSFSAARQLVIRYAGELYRDYGSVSEWFFAPDSEDRLVDHLAQTVVQYQEFRSGFAKKLESLSGDQLRRYVQCLRVDFLRRTHHVRSHYYVKHLARRMPNEIVQPWREALAHDLAAICQAHGEPLSYIEKLKTDAQYVGPETANLQFVASLLRVADMVHFSLDRAPLVLSSEMQFASEDSLVHWAIKQQGVNYDICESGTVGKKTIRFKAYCTNPRYYYELHKYLDWVDSELANYAKVSRRWELAVGKQASERWSIPLADEVDRSGIEYDAEMFVPVRGLSFSLEQKRILELLMGVRLYKDKYACLRELYQNSLDACKCMIALSDGKEKGRVDFWLERNKDGKEVQLCCLDNGIGMTKDIIVNHLLRIGNSYYTSPAFERLRVSHERRFTPTSQFGIGILSCFMLGDSLDIVTRPMQEFSDDTSPIRCTIDGVHENFYYATPDPADLEKIGQHGTIVRIRLHDANLITAINDERVWFRHFALRTTHMFSNADTALFKDWDKHLHNIVTKFVSLPRPDVDVNVQLADGTREPIIRWDRPFRPRDFNIDDADLLRLENFCQENRFRRDYEPEALPYPVQVYPCAVEHNGTEFSWLLQLPTSNDQTSVAPAFGSPGLSVDGVRVGSNVGGGADDILDWFCYSGYLDFTGETRPVLSVDRTSITSWPDVTAILSKELLQKVVLTTIAKAREHIEMEGWAADDPMVLASWDQLLTRFSLCTADFLTALSSDKRYSDVSLRDISILTHSGNRTLRAFLDADKICFPRVAYHELSRTAQLLFLGKCGNATRLEVSDCGVCVEGHGLSSLVATQTARHGYHFSEILLKCDDWAGSFSEYDLVTDFWPVVPARLFDRLLKTKRHSWSAKLPISERALEIHTMSNGITAIAEQEPCFVHPSLGIYHDDSSSRPSKTETCKIGRFEKASNEHWLFEINDWTEGEAVRNVLFVFVSPRPLTDEEELRLKDYESREPDYIKGVRGGWSLLFLGRKHMPPIIFPGVVSRNTIVNAIANDIMQKLEGENYCFLDGTPLLDARKR